MPERAGFNLGQVGGRSIVQLRVRPHCAAEACKALDLPDQALTWKGADPAVHWIGPDLWLLTSDTMPAGNIVRQIDVALSNQVHSATDMSSGLACYELNGPASRTVLAMGCGIDMHLNAFGAGQCTRTHFAGVPLFIVVTGGDEFNLYVDRSFAGYLGDWIEVAGKDPLTHNQAIPHSQAEAK